MSKTLVALAFIYYYGAILFFRVLSFEDDHSFNYRIDRRETRREDKRYASAGEGRVFVYQKMK
jgi:hypothetical protein